MHARTQAISAAEVISAYQAIATGGETKELAYAMILECNAEPRLHGCAETNEGSAGTGYEYAQESGLPTFLSFASNGGIKPNNALTSPSENARGFTAEAEQICSSGVPISTYLSGHTSYYQTQSPLSESQLMQQLQKGPLTIAIVAHQNSDLILSHDTAVITASMGASVGFGIVDHAVVIVGYGTSSDGINYWRIKNSWGLDAGNQGYFKVQRGQNLMGIGYNAAWPTGISDGRSSARMVNTGGGFFTTGPASTSSVSVMALLVGAISAAVLGW